MRISDWSSDVCSSDLFRINEGRLPERVQRHEVVDNHQEVLFDGCDVLIDAIFGSGLSRPPAGLYASVIESINNAEARSEGRRVGKACVSRCRSRWSHYHQTQKTNNNINGT